MEVTLDNWDTSGVKPNQFVILTPIECYFFKKEKNK